MSHPIIYGEKTLFITAPSIQFNTDSTSNTNVPPLTLNNSTGQNQTISTFQQAQVISTAPTVDTGTVATYQTRGAAATLKNGWVTLRDAASVGNSQVSLEIPAIQALTTTGSPTTLMPFGTATLAAAYRPRFQQSFPVDLVNNAGFVLGRCTITTAGVVSLQLIASGTFTAPFGLVNDTCIQYQITPAGL